MVDNGVNPTLFIAILYFRHKGMSCFANMT